MGLIRVTSASESLRVFFTVLSFVQCSSLCRKIHRRETRESAKSTDNFFPDYDYPSSTENILEVSNKKITPGIIILTKESECSTWEVINAGISCLMGVVMVYFEQS